MCQLYEKHNKLILFFFMIKKEGKKAQNEDFPAI